MSIIETVRATVNNLTRRRWPLGATGITQMQIPPSWNLNDLLSAYGDIGWFFRGASVIAHAVAKQGWHVYYVPPQGKREELDQHIALDLFRHVNPYHTLYELHMLQTLYWVIIGECFFVLDFNENKRPAAIWSAPPQFMNLVRERPTDYFSFYEYRMGGTRVKFDIPEIIHVKNPNPLNPLRGTGAGRAMQSDLNTEKLSTRYQEKLFYNDATPGMLLQFPDLMTAEQRQELMEEWKKEHQGWRQARKTGFLFGGATANTLTMNNRELDFMKSADFRGIKILDIMGVPRIIAGDTRDMNRATAEAAQFTFGEYTVLPILTQFREAYNEQLAPLYPQPRGRIEFDFDNPVPEDVDAVTEMAKDRLINCQITVNEARKTQGLDEIPEGNVFVVPLNMSIVPRDQFGVTPEPEEPEEPPAAPPEQPPEQPVIPSFFDSADEAHEYWESWITREEQLETPLEKELQELFGKQRDYALAHLSESTENLRAEDLFNEKQAKEDTHEIFKEHFPHILEVSQQAAEDLIRRRRKLEPEPEYVAGASVILWLEAEALWAAEEISSTTNAKLRILVQQAVTRGAAPRAIASMIREQFGSAIASRALQIARTEVVKIANVAAVDAYKKAGIKMNEWMAVMDERTCPDCQDLHTKTYKVGKGPMPPKHINCRCTLIPVVEGVPT